MLRFLRRVFIILILLIIVFFIFRFIKPEATSRFVDKVKGIPTTISSRFHREKKSEIVINGNTTSTNSNFDIGDSYNINEYDEDIIISTNSDENDNEINDKMIEDNSGDEIKNSWLYELNKQLDKLMASGSDTEEVENIDILETGDDNAIEITENTGSALPSGFVVIDIEQPYTGNTLSNSQESTTNTENTTNNTTTNITSTGRNNVTIQNNKNTSSTTNSSITTDNPPTKQQCGRCSIQTEGKCLSDQDCDQMIIDLGNINASN